MKLQPTILVPIKLAPIKRVPTKQAPANNNRHLLKIISKRLSVMIFKILLMKLIRSVDFYLSLKHIAISQWEVECTKANLFSTQLRQPEQFNIEQLKIM